MILKNIMSDPMARRRTKFSKPISYRIKAHQKVLENCGLSESAAAKAIGFLTPKERNVLIDAIREKKPVEEIVPRYYSNKKPNLVAYELWSRSVFRQAFVEFLGENGSSPEEVLNYIVDIMRNATRTVIKNDKRYEVPANDVRLNAAKLLLDRFAPSEKHTTVDMRSISLKATLNQKDINTDDTIGKLRAIEERIREVDARIAVENCGLLKDENDNAATADFVDVAPEVKPQEESTKVESGELEVSQGEAQPAAVTEATQPAPDPDAPPTINNIVTKP